MSDIVVTYVDGSTEKWEDVAAWELVDNVLVFYRNLRNSKEREPFVGISLAAIRKWEVGD